MNKITIIGIAGGTGSGKTTVVKKIVEALPPHYVAVVPLDSYYNDTTALTDEERKKRELQRAAEEQKNAILDLADEEGVERELTPEEKQHVKEREAIEKLINEKPAEVAMLVKTWLSED